MSLDEYYTKLGVKHTDTNCPVCSGIDQEDSDDSNE